MDLRRSTEPWPPRFQQWKRRVPSWVAPEQCTRSPGETTPASRAARATTILKVEPGG